MMFIREETGSTQRPLIFIGHSLGGLVIKSVLLHSAQAEDNERNLRAIKSVTLGVLFLGTPHQSVSLGDIVKTIISLYGRTEIKESESHWLETQLDQFKSISTSLMIFCCYEKQATTSANSPVSRAFQTSSTTVT